MSRRSGFVRRALTLTPLGDVIFLLLLFFMLTSTFSRFAEVEIGAATGETAQMHSKDVRFVQLGPDDIRLTGQPVSLDDLAGQLESTTTLLSLSPNVDAQRLIDVLGRIRVVADLSLKVLR